jgi:small-conductance mechanosensitive channel
LTEHEGEKLPIARAGGRVASIRFGLRIPVYLLMALAMLTPPSMGARAADSPVPPAVAVPSNEAPQSAAPDLADLVPRATQAAERLRRLRAAVEQLRVSPVDPAALEKRAARVAELEQALEHLGKTRTASHDHFADLKTSVRDEDETLERFSEQLTEKLRRIDALRVECLEEVQYWQKAARVLAERSEFEGLRESVASATSNAEQALTLVTDSAAPNLEVQQRVGALRGRLQVVATAIDTALRTLRDDIYRRTGFPLTSPRFFEQFKPALLEDLRENLGRVSWPEGRFFASYDWVILLQVAVAVVVVGAIRRRREVLAVSPRWGFLASHPLAAGAFVGFPLLTPLYGSVLPPVWRLLMWLLTAFGVARLVGSRVHTPWQRRLLYLLASLFLLTQVLRVVGVPLPIFRLYVLFVSLLGAPLCFWRARVNRATGGPRLYVLGLELGGAMLVLSAVTQVAGYSAFATHILESAIQTTFVILLAWILAVLAGGALELALGPVSVLFRFSLIRKNSAYLSRRLKLIVDGAVVLWTIGLILRVWRVYDTPFEGLHAVLALGFSLGEQRITVGLILGAAAIFYGSILLSGMIQDVLMEEVYPHSRMEKGVRISMNRLVHYAIVAVGFFFAVGTLGMDFKNITILAGAFSIGIGFGLQNIVNNFVSGLILLFERPIKVGDVVMLDGEWARIKKLGLRATIVQTFGRSDIIVPNSDLVSNKVINWTLSDRLMRLEVPVGVAYGSDVPLTMKVLQEIGVAHPEAQKDPEPQVMFRAFGGSSLDFELRVWVDADRFQVISSELHQEVDRRFREAGIEIAFPQRDLHLRTVDERARRALVSVATSPGDSRAVPGDTEGKVVPEVGEEKNS